jgi:acetyl-CoA carboxylase carboxyl transferase subunit alpha
MTAEDLQALELIDGIVPEPPGGAHEDWDVAAELLKGHLISRLGELQHMDATEIVAHRYEKFRRMGNFFA